MLLENDPTHVAEVRRMKEEGKHGAEMLHWLTSRGLEDVEMMSVLREAFDLGFDDVSCIGGWFEDGSGELSDEQINALLDAAVYPAESD